MKPWKAEYDSGKKEWRIYNILSQVPPLFILKDFGDPSDGEHLVSLLNAYSKSAEIIRQYEHVMTEIVNNEPEDNAQAKKFQDLMAKRLREDG